MISFGFMINSVSCTLEPLSPHSPRNKLWVDLLLNLWSAEGDLLKSL